MVRVTNKTNFPSVTVIVPVFNQNEKYLEESFSSISNQTFTDFECIVIDESTDSKLAEICKKICNKDSRFFYIHNTKKLGIPSSLNLGISLAKGKFIARFDSDDISINSRLEKQVEFMEKNIHVGVLGGGIEIIDENGLTKYVKIFPKSCKSIYYYLQFVTPLAHPTTMIRKSIFQLYGAYEPSYKYCEDLDLWLRLQNSGVIFANLNIILIKYRQISNIRNNVHWKFNIKSRLANFNSNYVILRVLGIFFVSIWIILPYFIKKFFIDNFIFWKKLK